MCRQQFQYLGPNRFDPAHGRRRPQSRAPSRPRVPRPGTRRGSAPQKSRVSHTPPASPRRSHAAAGPACTRAQPRHQRQPHARPRGCCSPPGRSRPTRRGSRRRAAPKTRRVPRPPTPSPAPRLPHPRPPTPMSRRRRTHYACHAPPTPTSRGHQPHPPPFPPVAPLPRRCPTHAPIQPTPPSRPRPDHACRPPLTPTPRNHRPKPAPFPPVAPTPRWPTSRPLSIKRVRKCHSPPPPFHFAPRATTADTSRRGPQSPADRPRPSWRLCPGLDRGRERHSPR